MRDKSMNEFIGTAAGDTIGLVVSNLDSVLQAHMGYDTKFRAFGIIGSRTGAGGQIKAVDDAVKATNTKVLAIQLPRDTKGGGGHGNFIVIGAMDVSAARACIEKALEYVNKNAGELYITEAGHLEFQYSARAGEAIHKAFGSPMDKAYGFICAAPAPIGMVIADRALKAAPVDVVTCMTPNKGTSHSNEVILIISGESSAVYTAVREAKDNGIELLGKMGTKPTSLLTPYI
ncbi:MAG: microcompartment protein PduB [Lachnospiraceae bacterium]